MVEIRSRQQVRHHMSVREEQRLRRAGFTVTNTAITGSGTAGTANPEGTLMKALYGGRGKLNRLKKTGIRTS